MHGKVPRGIALYHILRLFLGGASHVGLKFGRGRDLLLNRSADSACFRIPTHVVADFEFVFPHVLPQAKILNRVLSHRTRGRPDRVHCVSGTIHFGFLGNEDFNVSVK